jgi:hypothetical protein
MPLHLWLLPPQSKVCLIDTGVNTAQPDLPPRERRCLHCVLPSGLWQTCALPPAVLLLGPRTLPTARPCLPPLLLCSAQGVERLSL